MKAVLLGLSLLFSVNALASGSFSCNGEDKELAFKFIAATGSMFGSPIVNASGSLEFKTSKKAQDIRAAEFTKENIVNYWSEETGAKKVALYYEGGTDDFFGEVQVTLKLKPDPKAKEESEGSGTIHIKKIITSSDGNKTETERTIAVKCLIE